MGSVTVRSSRGVESKSIKKISKLLDLIIHEDILEKYFVNRGLPD